MTQVSPSFIDAPPNATLAPLSDEVGSPVASARPPKRAQFAALAADIKLHHSIFALPWAVLAMVLAATRTHGGLHVGQVLLILLCMVTGRTFGMVANRLFDAETDALNPRTARRALPSGRVGPAFLISTMLVCAATFVGAAAGFQLGYHNPWPLAASVPVLLFLGAYPFLKRFTEFCHYYLGAALALAPVCAWLAIAGRLAAPPLVMAAAVFFWTAGFDILYACQDYAFDVAHSLFSIPSKLGIGPALWVARFSHLLSFMCIIALGMVVPQLHGLYWIGVAVAGGLLVVEHSLVRANDLSKVNLAFFTVNGVISLLLGAMGTIDVLMHH